MNSITNIIKDQKLIDSFIDIIYEEIVSILGDEYRNELLKRKDYISVNFYSIVEHEKLFILEYGTKEEYDNYLISYQEYELYRNKCFYIYLKFIYDYLVKHNLLVKDYNINDLSNGLYFESFFEKGVIDTITNKDIKDLRRITGNYRLILNDIKDYINFREHVRKHYIYNSTKDTKRGKYIERFYHTHNEYVENYYDRMSSCLGYTRNDEEIVYSIINVPLATKCVLGNRQYIPLSITHEFVHGITTEQAIPGSVGISFVEDNELKYNALNEIITQLFSLYIMKQLKNKNIDIKLPIDDYAIMGGNIYEEAASYVNDLINEDNIVSIIKMIIDEGPYSFINRFNADDLNKLDKALKEGFISNNHISIEKKEQAIKLISNLLPSLIEDQKPYILKR